MQVYNLIDEAWIPVQRRSGKKDWIRPEDIVDSADPPLRVASPRPDFDSGITQFLIGLAQTTAAPQSEIAWQGWAESAPSPAVLRDAFVAAHHAFNLNGEGPRFMQDLEMADGSGKAASIRGLLIDAPGENTLKENKDHFIKRAEEFHLGAPMAAAALYTLQAHAPSGGQGHRVSLRGGGPLNTILRGETLWETVWLNVLPAKALASAGDWCSTDKFDALVFPWLAPTRTSQNDETTVPTDVDPRHQYWAMPRRIRLDFGISGSQCSIAGLPSELQSGTYRTLPKGFNYDGAWRHPLTPYYRKKLEDMPISKKPNPAGLPYRDWPGLALGTELAKPAHCLQHYRHNERSGLCQATLWSHGYDMDNMKARSWVDVQWPIFADIAPKEDAVAEALYWTAEVVEAAESVQKDLVKEIKAAMFRHTRHKSAPSFEISRSFWANTESEFFALVGELLAHLDDAEGHRQAREDWLAVLHHQAMTLFQDYSQMRGDVTGLDMERVAKSRLRLQQKTNPKNKTLRKKVELPTPSQEKNQ